MATETKITFDLDKLEAIRDKLGSDIYARVGILGAAKNGRGDGNSGLTNSELGVIQMFGSHSKNIPARDFLNMPIVMKQKELVKVLGSRTVKEKIARGDIEGVFKIIGIQGEAIVQEAFATGGFGQWQGNAESTKRQKGSASPLIDSGQLRQAVTSDVVKK